MSATEPKGVRDVLVEARELIAVPERWCQETLARDSEGFEADPSDEEACQFCAIGAVLHVARAEYVDETPGTKGASGLLNECARALHDDADALSLPIVALNDDTDHPTTLRAFDCAIAKAS
jgi:hypothetical protein